MQNHQESLNSEIQTLTEHLQNLTNRTFKNQIKILMQDQWQNNYSAKLQLQQSQYKQIALPYNDSSVNLTQQITQKKPDFHDSRKPARAFTNRSGCCPGAIYSATS